MGPLELLAVRFPGNHFKGEIAESLAELVEAGTIRVIDILFAMKDSEGNLLVAEINDLPEDDFATFDPIIDDDLTGMLSEEDARNLAATIEPNSSAAIMLFENVWATRFRDAILNADGELVLSERIPKAVVDEILGTDSYAWQRAA
jgi:hypothetical protein